MKKWFALFVMLLFSSNAFGAVSICTPMPGEDTLFGAKTVHWDEETGKARMEDMQGRKLNGIITNIRKHNKGSKVNLLFKLKDKAYGADETELLIFPVSDNEYRIIQVKYIIKNGVRLLDKADGNYKSQCLTQQ